MSFCILNDRFSQKFLVAVNVTGRTHHPEYSVKDCRTEKNPLNYCLLTGYLIFILQMGLPTPELAQLSKGQTEILVFSLVFANPMKNMGSQRRRWLPTKLVMWKKSISQKGTEENTVGLCCSIMRERHFTSEEKETSEEKQDLCLLAGLITSEVEGV